MSISDRNLHAMSLFATVAAEYCRLIDSFAQGRPAKLYSKMEELLPRLQIAVLPIEKELPRRKHRKFAKLRMASEQFQQLARTIGGIVCRESHKLFEEHGA